MPQEGTLSQQVHSRPWTSCHTLAWGQGRASAPRPRPSPTRLQKWAETLGDAAEKLQLEQGPGERVPASCSGGTRRQHSLGVGGACCWAPAIPVSLLAKPSVKGPGPGPWRRGLGRPRCCWRSPRGARVPGLGSQTLLYTSPRPLSRGPAQALDWPGGLLGVHFSVFPPVGRVPWGCVWPLLWEGLGCQQVAGRRRPGADEAEPDPPARTGTRRLGADFLLGGASRTGPAPGGGWRVEGSLALA